MPSRPSYIPPLTFDRPPQSPATSRDAEAPADDDELPNVGMEDAAGAPEEHQREQVQEEEDTIQDLLDYGDGEMLDYGDLGGSEVDEDEELIAEDDQDGNRVQEGGAEAAQKVSTIEWCHTCHVCVPHGQGTSPTHW